MTRIVSLDEVQRQDGVVVTVGTFDGVHAGHQALLRYVSGRARDRGGRGVAVTFDPHPREVLYGHPVRLLSTVDERAADMDPLGIEELVVVRFTREFARMSAVEFVRDVLMANIGMQEIVIGYDFTFGHGREGDSALLQALGRENGFAVDIVPAQVVDAHVVSSSEIRRLIADAGDVRRAGEMLGRAYGLDARVVRGEGRGKGIGYPTANLEPLDRRKVVPAQGVYAVHVNSADGGVAGVGMMNIGRRPTFGEDDVHLEVHIFDFTGDLYGKQIRVEFDERIRDERRFDSVDALVEQLQADENRCRALLGAVS